MLIFRSEEHVARWCRFRDMPRGGTISPQQCWQLAQAWYADKVSPDWRRKTLEDAEAMLADIGLTDPFWSLRG